MRDRGSSKKLRGNPLSRILPPKETEGESITTSVRIPERLLERINEHAKAKRYSRNEVIVRLLRFGLEELERQEKAKD